MQNPKSAAREHLSKREQQIMDIVYRLGKATVTEVIEQMQDPPSYSAVRALMSILERKGQLSHEKDGLKYVFLPAVAPKKASRTALKRVLNTFFNDSVEEALSALMDIEGGELSEADYDKLLLKIKEARALRK